MIILPMAFSYDNLPILTNGAATTKFVTWSNGPWIPQTPDPYQDPDFRKKWQEERDSGEEE